MAKCDLCGKEATLSAVVNGVYYKHICVYCNSKGSQVSSGHARWERGLDAEDREADIQQPYNSDGTINTRFAKLYPKQAEALFSKEELDKAIRS